MYVHAVKIGKELTLPLFGLLFAAIVAHCNTACQPPMSADESYKAELVTCSASGHSRAEIDACRKLVNQKYNVCEAEDGWPRYRPCK